VIWDGHTASAEAAVKAAKANISIEEQIQHIHKLKGLLPDEEKDKIGPTLPPSTTSGSQGASAASMSQNTQKRHQPQSHAPPSHSMPLVTSNPPLIPQPPPMQTSMAGLMAPPGGGPFMMPPGLGMYGMPVHLSMLSQLPPSSMAAAGYPPQPEQAEEEPPNKMQRTDVIPEEEYIKMNPNPITFSVQVPVLSDKPEWNLKGQILDVTMTLSEQVSALKAKIHQETGLPPSKQKLQYDTNFLKDSNTLASYNISPSSCILLALKERGGRKK
jgi:splicing factor 3A subunit 1